MPTKDYSSDKYAIRSDEDFKTQFRVRPVERCCATCLYGVVEFDECATCKHPFRNDYDGDDCEPNYATYNVAINYVCDGWTKRK